MLDRNLLPEGIEITAEDIEKTPPNVSKSTKGGISAADARSNRDPQSSPQALFVRV